MADAVRTSLGPRGMDKMVFEEDYQGIGHDAVFEMNSSCLIMLYKC